MPVVEPLLDEASPHAPPPAIPILPPEVTLIALVPIIPGPPPSLAVPTQHPTLASPTPPAHTTAVSTSGPSMIDAPDLRSILHIPPIVHSMPTAMPEYVIIDDEEEDHDDHSSINYDDIIVDDEQDGAGMDEEEDEDPEEIEPMTDGEE
ncbi:hypothetical protein GUJ93_ZPchr0004g39463 [Zizania palustris]|uniref:Uncharacterized protein n=1 Tax=Zizania palustris TaxID=103762 RepID=A0A8J5SGL2_ZIZPA|nr:hypothetical protein GUJ93_ZPchr0004g39463 [Zizania palustris]